ncbi:acetylornithine deacetylase-like [Dysidea avara]|uniref:acetylornithine deacetylase-like n=1 Tax=Dysidea avara TaxID=196820 RepID=UPI003316FABB
MEVELDFDEARYLKLLTNLIGETEHLQNNPPNFIPEEDRAVKHVLDALQPYTKENGGLLKVEHVAYVDGRGNVIIEYDNSLGRSTNEQKTISFIGSHLDVVPADPNTWERDPFKLTIEGDKLYGRGTTDCLGHVAMLTEMFIQLAEKKPKMKRKIAAVFIAAEESNLIPGVGIDMLLKDGKLDHYKAGPVYWVDSSDVHPRIGSASAAIWRLNCLGRLSHSGLPHKGINSVELAMDAVTHTQKRFYQDYPPHPSEAVYKFICPSTMKPTQIKSAEGSVNQIPPQAEVQGDIRLTPFYSITECLERVKGYVAELNKDINVLVSGDRGPCSKYEISTSEGDFKGELEIFWEGEIYKGIACDLDSDGHKALDEATKAVIGSSEPFSSNGSLPLVGEMQEAGFDIQMCGYGHSSVYHGDNEYCSLSYMKVGLKIFNHILNRFNQ